jgi:hypothetical protein
MISRNLEASQSVIASARTGKLPDVDQGVVEVQLGAQVGTT